MEGLRKAESPLIKKRTKLLRSGIRSRGIRSRGIRSRGIRSSGIKRISFGTKRISFGTKRLPTARRSGTRISFGTKRLPGTSINAPMTRGKSKIYNTASKKITQFFKQTQHTRKARYLRTVNRALCADAGLCLAIGTLADVIKQHFHGFTPFDYVVPNITKIGAESANGFINQIN